MNLIVLFNPMEYVGALINPRTWIVAAVAVFAWRPFVWTRRLLVALVAYLLVAVLIELAIGTHFGPVLRSQLVLGLVATALWYSVFQIARRQFTGAK